ncbi:hypothetical protein J3459_012509 [Metarhizium acridum]|uniref:uncharacterized protein n=1 Tax=Metarhizium acridum TaxID=92637 RepID=UPI001C6B9655|nr:hypothetical protein J3459_012509 [Metarhizium acridum]KAG8419620.1 hypothetical protein J3458_004475 [Metarhizium acridum]
MSDVVADRKRHCWECRRRCLVCDSAQPDCKRCVASGTICPGYGDIKPARLRWLDIGRVKSRNKRSKRTVVATDEESTKARHQNHAIKPCEGQVTGISRHRMKTDLCALSEAVGYFNGCIYYDLVPMEQLGSNPFVYAISERHIKAGTMFPDYLRLTLVCTTLSHRINRLGLDPNHGALAQAFYQYRGVIIRSLREDASDGGRHISDVFIAGVVMLLLIDVSHDIARFVMATLIIRQVQHGASSNWRCHLEAIQRLITLRGGIKILAKSKRLDSLLLCFLGVSVLGNTTCPAHDIAMTDNHVKELEYMIRHYQGATFSFQMCPPPLFAEIIRMNSLRMRAAERQVSGEFSIEAYEILARIEEYSPTQWASSKPAAINNWLTLGAIYKLAAAIYCILSLQSSSVLPRNLSLRNRCVTHTQQLKSLLESTVANLSLKRFLLWPLIVLGVEASRGDLALKIFIEKQLAELSCHLGSYVPLAAKSVLERFWALGETDWDVCFDKPYAFATQIAVDLSRISPND